MKTIATILVLSVLAVAAAPIPGASKGLDSSFEIENQQSGAAHTPPKGSAERKAIINGLRAEMKQLHQMEFIFMVDYLKVKQGWAWIEARPQSPDGTSNFESVSALLRKGGQGWEVAQIACTEEDNPDCLGQPDFFEKLRAKFPQAPKAIFPS